MLVGAARLVMAELAEVSDPAVAEPVGLLAQVIEADTEPDPDGGGDGETTTGRWPRIGSSVCPTRRCATAARAPAAASTATRWTSSPTRRPNWYWGWTAGRQRRRRRGRPAPARPSASVPGLTIATVVGDMAYSDGDLHAGIEQRGHDLAAARGTGRRDDYRRLRRRRGPLRRSWRRRPPRHDIGPPFSCWLEGTESPPPPPPPPPGGEPFLSACITSAWTGPTTNHHPEIKSFCQPVQLNKDRPSADLGSAKPATGPTENQTSKLHGRHGGQDLPS